MRSRSRREEELEALARSLAGRAAETARHPLRVAVTGITACGKSTLAAELAASLERNGRRCHLLPVDGFHNPRAVRYRQGRESAEGYYRDAYDDDALVRRVLLPLGPDGDGSFVERVHDLESDAPVEAAPIRASPGSVVLLEGSFLLRRELREHFDYRVLVQTSFDEARRRGVARDRAMLGGEEAAERLYRARYHAAQRLHLEEDRPFGFTDAVLFNEDAEAPTLLVRPEPGRAPRLRASAAWDTLPDPLPEGVRRVLEELVGALVHALEGSVEAVVLFGSLAAGGFDPERSDLDLIVALPAAPDDTAFEALRRMHAALATAHPEWEDRVDVAYVAAEALRDFREREHPLVTISPGEPLTRKRTDRGWIMNWHLAREQGLALLGPEPRELIAPTTTEDFLGAVCAHMRWMLAKVERSEAPSALRAYSIVTGCRALHACATGRQASKHVAAAWVAERHPEWSETIREATTSSRGAPSRAPAVAEPVPRALEFVRFVVDGITSTTSLR